MNNITFTIYELDQDFFFKVPEIKQETITQTNIHNILLYDSSGSMISYWTKIAKSWNKFVEKLNGSTSIILFSNNAFRHTGKTLPLYMLQSGGTNIIAGLNELEKEIFKYKDYDLIRIYFITDGKDSNHSTFESRFNNKMNIFHKPITNVEFYVFGLTENFPVFISQSIKANLHTGSVTIPNLFWSQNCTDEEITNEFANIEKFNKIISKIHLPCEGNITPFSNSTNEFNTGDWVIISKQNEIPNWFESNGDIYQLEINKKPSFSNLLEMFSQWVGQLQIISIKLSNNTNLIKKYSLETKEKMELMYTYYVNQLPIVNIMKTFTERIQNKQIKTLTYQYKTYLKIVTDLGSGIKLQFMDNIELAKQLKGVYVGKYSQKAYELSSYTDEDFNRDKEEFIKILDSTLPLLKNIESNERCVITLDNTLDILRSEEFIQTLRNTTSKIEFLQNIGITGNGVMLNITDASTINPWVTQIKNVAKHCSIISTTTIEELIDNSSNTDLTEYEKNNCIVTIKTGNGLSEKINCVIPLFEKEIATIMKPIICSNLFQLICTYSIQKTPFTLNHNAHLGALSGLLGHLLSEPNSEWRKITIQKICNTTSVYLGRKKLEDFIEKLWKDPNRAVVTEIPDENIKCESITKLLLMILVSAKNKTSEEIALVMTHVWKEYIGRIIGNKNDINECFELSDINELSDQIIFPDFNSIYKHGFTISETKKYIEKEIRLTKFNYPNSLNIKLNIDKLKNEWNGGSVGNITWKGLTVFTNTIGYDISDKNIFQFVTHCLKHTGSADRMSSIESYNDSKEWVINELIGIKFSKLREEIITNYKLQASERYFNSFKEEHQTILPMDIESIINDANKIGINVNQDTFDSIYKINPNNKLLNNACMSKECPYYLHPRLDFSSHIERIKSNPDFIHSFHRTIYSSRNNSLNEIINDISKGNHRPIKYNKIPILNKSIIEKYSEDIKINKDIYMAIYN